MDENDTLLSIEAAKHPLYSLLPLQIVIIFPFLEINCTGGIQK